MKCLYHGPQQSVSMFVSQMHPAVFCRKETQHIELYMFKEKYSVLRVKTGFRNHSSALIHLGDFWLYKETQILTIVV